MSYHKFTTAIYNSVIVSKFMELCISHCNPSLEHFTKKNPGGFPGGAVVENPPANAADTGSSPGLGRSHMPRSN